ncbi:MAG: DegT/DnrJ/EryC1/StrS family aminotransferase [Candidatus Omnitrophica bacterium]|nr:DegT/DnrJ/EryC1/StrS family aminotransferase [Candidatus Omnitrophota bacterium]
MQVPFVDLPKQIAPYKEDVRGVIEDVIFNRADFIMRDDLLAFERNFAQFVGTDFSVGVANGSDAINLSLKILGVGPGDEVITVAHTFIATIAAIVHAGATPVLVDVDDDYNINVDLIEPAITAKTKAIIVVHLNGRACDMDRIMGIAKKHNLFIVEDSAQGIGAIYKGKKAGSFGDLSTNSFYPFKILGCFGDGGAITTNDPDLNYQLRCLRDNGQDRVKGDILFWGWNSRLDNLQAGILNVLLKHLPDMIHRRRAIAALYDQGLSGIKEVKLPPAPNDGEHFDSFQNYVIRTKQRDALVKHLSAQKIGTLISWKTPNHHHKNLGLTKFHLPNTESISQEVVSLPMHPALSDEEIRYVIDNVGRFFKR